MNTIVVENVHKRFGNIHALRGLSMNTHKGEIYGLLGPNGAGKSTLIRTIVGLHTPDKGQATLLGVQMPNRDILSRVGYMTQASALYDELTVWQNVAFFAGLMDCNDKSAIAAAIDFVDLSARRQTPISELSGGMRQRVSLATVLVHKPDLILLDEPTVGVDPQLRVQFWRHFRQLADNGVTLLVSSHVMDEAERCDRLGFVREGQLLAEGSANELRERAGTSNLEEAFLVFAGEAVHEH